MTIRNTVRRLTAGAGVLALAMTGVALTGTAASADPGPDQVPGTTKGSLNIHKRLGTEGAAGDGTLLDPAPGDGPLEGAEFTVWQLGTPGAGDACTPIDLRDTNEWSKVPTGTAPATVEEVEAAGFCLTQIGKDTTAQNGDLVFSNLDLSLYYVQETDVPDNIVSRTAPFYVSVPTLNGNDWIYNVHVYPKNLEGLEPEKSINDDDAQEGLAIGDTVEWTIKQIVPALKDGDTYDSVVIWDVLPADELAYADTTSVTLDGVELDDADYDIDPDGVSWTLTGTGRAKLTAGAEIKIVFTTTVLKVTDTGAISNPGSDGTSPGYRSEFNGSSVPGDPTPYTYWGQLKVTKVDSSTPARPLAGAEFKVFPKTGTTCSDTVPATGLVADGTSGNDGVVTWVPNEGADPTLLGLFIANSSDGELTPPISKDYCLYETKAPAGYTAANVQQVTITPGTTLVAGGNDITAVNTPRQTPDLPLTGAQGTLVMTLGGLALVGLGTGALMIARRRRNKSA